MLPRLTQITRQFSIPSASTLRSSRRWAATMAEADLRNTRAIQTAACLIIGDEVLGGKVRTGSDMHKDLAQRLTANVPDCRCK